MNKHSVALILPYFGTFPNYFPLWLKSAGANTNFTFMIFTDNDMSDYDVPANVHVHSMTLEQIRRRAAKHLDFEPVLPTPYKVCDYRPMYGLIFEDYLEGCDFWGHVDPDVIWGNLGHFITDYLLDKYGRLYRRGHLELYRNTDEVNNFALHELPGFNISYRDVFSANRSMHYDELSLAENLFSTFTQGGGGAWQYDRVIFADLATRRKPFRRGGYNILLESIAAFRWINGRLYGLALDGDPETEQEYMYVHLQKRSMKFTPGLEKEHSFMIIPNEFVKDHALTQEEIDVLMTPDPEYERAVTAKYGSGIKRSIFERIRSFMKKDTASKIISIKLRWNKLIGRKLHSRYTQSHAEDFL